MRNFFASVRRYNQVRNTYRELSRLNDRELQDIGIHRGDIPRLARSAITG